MSHGGEDAGAKTQHAKLPPSPPASPPGRAPSPAIQSPTETQALKPAPPKPAPLTPPAMNGAHNGAAPRPRVLPLPPNVPKPTMYQLVFPAAFEALLAPLDDAVVRVVQRRTGGLLHSLVMSLTFFSAIEVALPAPAALYALGYDRAAALSGSVLWTLCIMSQIPKKFIFRPRPWMTGRALPIRQDKTSSFPSRAVVCAVVFSWLIGQSLFVEGLLPGPLSPVRLWAGIFVCAVATAFARVNVGAHYASDTLFGFLLGVAVIKVGSRVEGLWAEVGCAVADAYPALPGQVISSAGTLWRAPLHRLVFAIAGSYALTLVSIQGFWVKCSYVYGLLLASATFRGVFSCPGQDPGLGNGAVGPVLDHGGLQTHVKASVYFLMFLLFGMATRGNKGHFRIFSFSLIYFGSLVGVLYWRLRAA